jgi:hypothetical protein
MYRPITYPTNDVDPRLTSVATLTKQLRRQIDHADWYDKPVTQDKRDKLTNLVTLTNQGTLWIPKF